jgi:colanic acid/amylovoran biosynthesis glycosyltransferase
VAGIHDLIEAAAMIEHPRPRILLIGAGPLEGPIRERARELGLDTTFLGL